MGSGPFVWVSRFDSHSQGRCRVKLADSGEWREYTAGESFSIPGHSHFEIEVTELIDYVCHFT